MNTERVSYLSKRASEKTLSEAPDEDKRDLQVFFDFVEIEIKSSVLSGSKLEAKELGRIIFNAAREAGFITALNLAKIKYVFEYFKHFDDEIKLFFQSR